MLEKWDKNGAPTVGPTSLEIMGVRYMDRRKENFL